MNGFFVQVLTLPPTSLLSRWIPLLSESPGLLLTLGPQWLGTGYSTRQRGTREVWMLVPVQLSIQLPVLWSMIHISSHWWLYLNIFQVLLLALKSSYQVKHLSSSGAVCMLGDMESHGLKEWVYLVFLQAGGQYKVPTVVSWPLFSSNRSQAPKCIWLTTTHIIEVTTCN